MSPQPKWKKKPNQNPWRKSWKGLSLDASTQRSGKMPPHMSRQRPSSKVTRETFRAQTSQMTQLRNQPRRLSWGQVSQPMPTPRQQLVPKNVGDIGDELYLVFYFRCFAYLALFRCIHNPMIPNNLHCMFDPVPICAQNGIQSVPGVPLVSQIGVQSVQSGDPLPCNWAARIVGAFGNGPNIYDTLAQKGSGLPRNWTAGISAAICHGHTIYCGLGPNRLNKKHPEIRKFLFV